METVDFLDYFSELEDPRCEMNKLYSADELLFLTLCAVLCGAEGWSDVELFGESKLPFLRDYLPYAHGIPSDDTLRRFFRAIDSAAFAQMFVAWAQGLGIGGDRLIAVDGKTLCRSHDGASKALHVVSAFATEARLVLGQVKTEEKGNEITAIPELLRLLDVRGACVSIDAMGCQRAIAQQIIDGGGQYLLGLKGNQGTLHDDVRLFFEKPPEGEAFLTHEECDKGHGRIETRRCEVTSAIGWLQETHGWPALQSIVRITATRTIGDKITTETRLYLTSEPPDPARINRAVRSHWAIENSLHWVLDMSFNEDQSRIRKNNAPLAMAIVRHLALNLLRNAQTKRISIKALRKKDAWDTTALARILKP